MTSSGPPLDPTGLQVQWVTSYDIYVTWDSGNWSNGGLAIQNFTVKWVPQDNGGSFTSQNNTSTGHIIEGLNPGEEYAISVTANNADSPSTSSPGINTIFVRTNYIGQPLDPRPLTVLWTSPTQVAFSWNAADPNAGSPISDYAISWTPKGATGEAGHLDFGGPSGYTGLTGRVENLEPNAEYEFVIQAYNSDTPLLVSPGYVYTNATTTSAIPPYFSGVTGNTINTVAGLIGNGRITSTVHSYDNPANTTVQWIFNHPIHGPVDVLTLGTDGGHAADHPDDWEGGPGCNCVPIWSNNIYGTTGPVGSYGTITRIDRRNIGGQLGVNVGTFYNLDAGNYTCTITDRFGSATQSFTVNLTPGSTGPIPVHIVVSPDVIGNMYPPPTYPPTPGLPDPIPTYGAWFEFTKPRSGVINYNPYNDGQPGFFNCRSTEVPMIISLYKGPSDASTDPKTAIWQGGICASQNVLEVPLRIMNTNYGYLNDSRGPTYYPDPAPGREELYFVPPYPGEMGYSFNGTWGSIGADQSLDYSLGGNYVVAFGPGTYSFTITEYSNGYDLPSTRILTSELIHFLDTPPGFTGTTGAAENTYDIDDGDPAYWQVLFPSGTSNSANPPTITWTYTYVTSGGATGPTTTVTIDNGSKYIIENTSIRANEADPYFTFYSRVTRNNQYRTWTLADSGTYVCTVSNDFGSVKSTYVLNIAASAPVFPYLMDYQSGPAALGIDYTFAAPPVWGSPTIQYSWWYGGINAMGGDGPNAIGGLTGQTGPDGSSINLAVSSDSLTIKSVNANSVGRYFVKATNTYGSDYAWADITEVGALPYRNFLNSQTVPIGSFVSLFNDQRGLTPPITKYQWYKDGLPLTGQTGAYLTITDAGYYDSGEYNCIAENDIAAVSCVPATISLLRTTNSGLGVVETYDSGRGYSKAPTPYLSGAGQHGAISAPYADKVFIKNIPFSGVGWNNFTGTPTVLVNGVPADGSTGANGCQIIPIMHKNPTDYYINAWDRSNTLFTKQLVLYEPVNAEIISDSGVGAEVTVLRYDPNGIVPPTAIDLDFVACVAYNAAILAGRSETDATTAGQLAAANALAEQQALDNANGGGGGGAGGARLVPTGLGCGACPGGRPGGRPDFVLGLIIETGGGGSNIYSGCTGGVGWGCTGCSGGIGYGCTGCNDGVGYGCTGCYQGHGHGCTGCDNGVGYGCTGCFNNIGYGCTGITGSYFGGLTGCTGIGCFGRTGYFGQTGTGFTGNTDPLGPPNVPPPPCPNPPCAPVIKDCTSTIPTSPPVPPGGNILFIYDWGVGPNNMKVNVAYKNSFNPDDPNSYEHIVFASEKCVGDNQASLGHVLNSFNAKPVVLTRVLDWLHQVPPTADLVITRGDGDTTGEGLTAQVGFRDISSRSGTRTYAWGNSDGGVNGLYNKMWEPYLYGVTGGNNQYTAAPLFQLTNLRCVGSQGPCNGDIVPNGQGGLMSNLWNCLDQDAAHYANPKFGWYYSDLISEYGSPFQAPDVCSWKYDFTTLQGTTTLLNATALYGGAEDDYATTTANNKRKMENDALAFWYTQYDYLGLTGGTGWTGGVPPALGGAYTPGSIGGTGAYEIYVPGDRGATGPRNLEQAFAYFISTGFTGLTGTTFPDGSTGLTAYTYEPNAFENYGMDLPYEFGGYPAGGYQTSIDPGQATLQVLGGLVGFGGSTLGRGTWQAGGPYPPMGQPGSAMFPADALNLQKAIAAGLTGGRILAGQDTSNMLQPFNGYAASTSPDAVDSGSFAMLGNLSKYLSPAQLATSGRTPAEIITTAIAVGNVGAAFYVGVNYYAGLSASDLVTASTQLTINRSDGYTESIWKAPSLTYETTPGRYIPGQDTSFEYIEGGREEIAAQAELREYYDTYSLKCQRILELEYEKAKLVVAPPDPIKLPDPTPPPPPPPVGDKMRFSPVRPRPQPPLPPPEPPKAATGEDVFKGENPIFGKAKGQLTTYYGNQRGAIINGGRNTFTGQEFKSNNFVPKTAVVGRNFETARERAQRLAYESGGSVNPQLKAQASRKSIGTSSAKVDIQEQTKAIVSERSIPPQAQTETQVGDAELAAKEADRKAALAAAEAEQAVVIAEAKSAMTAIIATHSDNFERLLENPDLAPEEIVKLQQQYADFKSASRGLVEISSEAVLPKVLRQVGIDTFTRFLGGVEIPTADKLILTGAKIVTVFALEKGAEAFRIIVAAIPAIPATAPKVIRGISKGVDTFIQGSSRVIASAGSLITKTTRVITGLSVKLVGNIGVALFRAAFAIAGIIADVAALATGALQICSSFQFGGVGIYFPDPYASGWINGGFLPFTPGSIVLSKSSRVYGLKFSSVGQGYLPGDFVRITSGGIPAANTQYFQAIGALQPPEPYDVGLQILPMAPSFIVKGMAIASQGAGFTGAPNIGVTGAGGDTGAPPQWYANMTCSTLGPITHTSSDSFLVPPEVYISPSETSPNNPAKAIVKLRDAVTDAAGPGSGGSISRIDLINPNINRYFFDPTNKILPAFGLLTTGDDIGYQNFVYQIQYIMDRLRYYQGLHQFHPANNDPAITAFNNEMASDGGAPYIEGQGLADYTGATLLYFTTNFDPNVYFTVVVDPPTAPGGVQAVVGVTGRLVQETSDESTVAVTYVRIDGFVIINPGSGYLTVPNVTVTVDPYLFCISRYGAYISNGGRLKNPLMIEVPAVANALAPRMIENIYMTDHGKGYSDIPSEIFVYAGSVTQDQIKNLISLVVYSDQYKALADFISTNDPQAGPVPDNPAVWSSLDGLSNWLDRFINYANSNPPNSVTEASLATDVKTFISNVKPELGINALSNSGITPANPLWYENPATQRTVNGKTMSYYIIGTTVGSTGQFSQWSAYPSSFGYGYVESSAPIAIQDYYVNRIDVVSSAGSSGASGYTAGPPRVGLTGGGGFNCIYDVSVFPNIQGQSGTYSNNLLGLQLDVGTSGYYEIEPLTEFGNGEDYSGLNIVITPSPSDTTCDRLAFAEPIINGRIVSCAHSAGVAAYSSMKSQLPFNGVTVSATVYPMDGVGVSGAVEVDGWHYSFRLNAYVIDHVTITNPGSGYTEPPLVKVTFSAPRLHTPAYCAFYARIGGSLASVRVANSASGFALPPTISINPYNQASNTNPYVAPTLVDSLVNISHLAGTIANVTLTNQRLGFKSIPRVIAKDLPASGIIPSLSVRQELTYIHVDIIDPGFGYVTPPTVVITDKYGQGSGAVAKAIMNIPEKLGQSGPSGYEVNVPGVPGASGTARPSGTEFTVSGPSGPGYTYQPGQTGCVTGVAFVTYGNGYLGEVDITFVRNPADAGTPIYLQNGMTGTAGSGGRDAVAKAKVVHSSALGPPTITSATTDNNGEGLKMNVSVNTGLFIAGVTGTQNPREVLEIPHIIDGIQSIAFANQPNINYLTFEDPSRCWEIQEYAFSGCTGLSIVWLPESIQRIGDGAFENCPNLIAVIFKGYTGPALGNGVFAGSGGLTGTQFYHWQDYSYVKTYGGHSGWYDINYLGGTGYVNNVRIPLLDAEPIGVGGMIALSTDIIGTTGTTAKSQSIACDSQGNAYYSESFGSLYQVDVYGNQTTLQYAYDIREITIFSNKHTDGTVTDTLYLIDFTGSVWYQQLPWPLDIDPDFPNPHPQTKLCNIGDVGNTGLTHIVNDNNGYLYVSEESKNTIHRVSPDGTVIVWKTLTDSFPIGGLACDSNNNLSFSYPSQGLVYTYANSINSPKILVGTELACPTYLAYDNANNLYIACGEEKWASGIRILTSDGSKCSTYAAGFYTVGGIAINKVTSVLLFNDGFYLSQIPVSVSDISFNFLTALASHDYATAIRETGKTPKKIFTLTPADVITINSTLSDESQVALPTDLTEVLFVCPDTDGSISAPTVAPNASITYATVLKPAAETIFDLGSDRFTATFNDTSPPTITFVNIFGGPIPSTSPTRAESVTVAPGKSFTTYSGAKVTIYSIGLTIVEIVTGDDFIPGVRGDPPPVCRAKQQGIDYSQYLSGDVYGGLYPKYKENIPSSSEWLRRQRLKSSVKFGVCRS